MTVSKEFLNNQIQLETVEIEKQKKLGNTEAGNYHLGRLKAFELIYSELTKPPTKSEKEPKSFDVGKTYEDVVKYYVDKKGYTVEHANEIAQKVVQEQQQKRL